MLLGEKLLALASRQHRRRQYLIQASLAWHTKAAYCLVRNDAQDCVRRGPNGGGSPIDLEFTTGHVRIHLTKRKLKSYY